MDLLFNTSFKALLVKDVSQWTDWDEVDKDFNQLEWKPNVENTVSVDLNFFDREKYQPLKDLILTECKGFLDNTAFVGGQYEGLRMTNSWGNITEPGHSHHEHQHPFSVVSGVIYLDDNPSNFNLNIESYIPEVPYFMPVKRNYARLGALINDAQIDPTSINHLKHHMILFLSNSHHFVDIVPEGQPSRRSIAFNTFWSGRTGMESALASIDF